MAGGENSGPAAKEIRMLPLDVSRRQFLAIAGGTAAVAWLVADWDKVKELAARGAAAKAGGAAFANFSAPDGAALTAFAARIIPTDETPGATEAGAVYFIDKAVGGFAKAQRPAFDGLIKSLNAEAGKVKPRTAFASLSAAEQDKVMRRVEKAHPDFFGVGRFAVLAGTFASPHLGGNKDNVGWKLIGFENRGQWSAPYGYYDRDRHSK
jgi:gluconate 2-dehydrogenase gamma chain